MKVQKAYSTVDVHVSGEAFRIIQSPPFIHFQSLEELYKEFIEVFKDERDLLLNEPRGFAGLNGCLVLPPVNREADAAVLFFNHEGTVPVNYSGVIAVITALLECGHLQARASNEYKIETVRGIIPVIAIVENDEVVSVKLESGPCQAVETGLYHQGLKLNYDLVEADQLYAVFQRDDLSPELSVEKLSELRRWGQKAFEGFHNIIPPVKGAVLMDKSALGERLVKTITFRDDQFIVRSPGFGPTLACYTSLRSQGELALDRPFVNESISGSRLEVHTGMQKENGYHATIVTRGFITGMQTFILDPTDSLPAGFLLK